MWNHRPEYQFSRYSLEIDEINRVQVDPDTGDESSEDIFNTDTPVIGSSDNLDHLAGLAPEDFLTMRLYLNQDAGNVLWEYAFEFLDLRALIDPDDLTLESGFIPVSADFPEIELSADLVGYANRSEENKEPVRMIWAAPNGGSLATQSEVDADQALFRNTLTTSRNAGTKHTVKAMLDTGASRALSQILSFQVVPGQPANIDVSTEGQMSLLKLGSVKVLATVKDAHGNSVDDNTAVNVTTEGPIELASEVVHLENGVLELEVVGTHYAEAANLVIRAGEVEREIQLEVKPLTVEIQSQPDSLETNTNYSAQLKVVDTQGSAVEGVEVEVYSDIGRVAETSVVTDAQGTAC